jgi:hypothetical protein
MSEWRGTPGGFLVGALGKLRTSSLGICELWSLESRAGTFSLLLSSKKVNEPCVSEEGFSL